MSTFLDKNGLTYFWGKIKTYVTTNFLSKSGGQVTGAINMSGSKIQNLGAGTSDTEAVNYGQVKAVSPKIITMTLPTSGWSNNTRTVSAPGVLADVTKQIIYVAPAPASQENYIASGISCIEQGANTLKFSCKKVPTSALTVYATIQPVGS